MPSPTDVSPELPAFNETAVFIDEIYPSSAVEVPKPHVSDLPQNSLTASVPKLHSQNGMITRLAQEEIKSNPQADFEKVKQEIIYELRNKQSKGGAYLGVAHDIERCRDENEILKKLQKYQGYKDVELIDRVKKNLTVLFNAYPELEPKIAHSSPKFSSQ